MRSFTEVYEDHYGSVWGKHALSWNRTTWIPLTREETEQYRIKNLKEEKMAETKVVAKPLSMCLLVSREAFALETASKQTEILTGASGKPIVFVDNFSTLRNKKKLIEKLLAGEDVGMELEFNDIELTPYEGK